MRVSDFDFELPEELIAQTPLKDRSASRLLVVSKDNLEDKNFYNIKDYLNRGDVLVLNDTRVMAARLLGIKEETGAKVELLILRHDDYKAECLVGNAKVVKLGTLLSFGNGQLKARCIAVHDEGLRDFEFIYQGIFLEILDELGQMPLPPYIHEKLEDRERYQTVYAKVEGSAAAPTAGLHFSKELLRELEDKGVIICFITLHVGLATFRPVKANEVLDHKMHKEWYAMSEKTAAVLNQAQVENRRIVAVGTTSVRTLETIYERFHAFVPCSGESDIFIYPGFKFKAVDALITNFHLPKSTLMMLVSAFSGKTRIMHAYQHAIAEQYRFFSFGDSMFLTYKEEE